MALSSSASVLPTRKSSDTSRASAILTAISMVASKSDLKGDWELFGYVSFMSSGAPPTAGITSAEDVTTFKLGLLKYNIPTFRKQTNLI